MTRSRLALNSSVSSFIMLLLAAGGAGAQTTGPATEQLEDVVVTAQRRVEKLQDVPISISATRR